ncbi:MAG: hypothetical protein ACTSRO_04365 [Candidatus Heimdallarchaeaceae archaeon]
MLNLNNKKILSLCILTLLLPMFLFTTTTEAIQNLELKKTTLESIDRSAWFWEDVEVLSTFSSTISYHPHIISDSKNNIYVFWYDSEDYSGSGTDIDIFMKKWEAKTETWLDAEILSTESTENSVFPVAAVDQNDNIYLVWEDWTDLDGAGTDEDVFLKRYFAQNNSWTSTEIVSTESSSFSTDSDIAVDRMGNIYITWKDDTDYNGAGSDYDIFFKEWFSSNSSWSDTVVISSESTDNSLEPRITVTSEGVVVIVWSDWTNDMTPGDGADSDIYAKQRRFNESWSDLLLISSSSTSISCSPDIVSDDIGDLFICWTDYTNISGSGVDPDIFLKTFDERTKIWSDVEIVSSESTSASTLPSITIDSFGSLHFTWTDITDLSYSGSDLDIFYRRKDIQSDTWSSTLIVTSIENTGPSTNSEIIVDSHGYINIVWHDTSNLYNSGSDTDIFFRKFVGPPSSPILAAFSPNPSYGGNITVDWNNILGAKNYKIYRSPSYIWSVSALAPIEIVSTNEFVDQINITGTYYYAIVAQNSYGESNPSNIESISIIEEPKTTQLGFFQTLRLGEIVVLAGILGGFQLILTIITYSLLKTTSSKKKKSKKK